MVKERSDNKYIQWFSELGKEDVKEVGGKSANLGEMYNAGMPVPPGFSTTAQAYKYFLEETGLINEIYGILKKVDIENTAELEKTAKEIQKMIIEEEIPDDMKKEIVTAYESLSFNKDSLVNASDAAKQILRKGFEPIFVAVRSSATAEDTEKASFAGQQETFLNVKGRESLLLSIKKCFASLFSPRSIYYRVRKGFEHEDVLIAVVVQVMVNSDKSGVIFSKDPVEFSDNIVIEAVFGLGEGIVSGRIKPDHYVVSRDFKLLSKEIAEKKTALVRDSSGKTIEVKLTEDKSRVQVLNNEELMKLAEYALKLEEHYGRPQDIEFAIDSQQIYIVQTRPVTTLAKEKKAAEIKGKEILTGQPASPGIGSGTVKVIHDLTDLKKIMKGDILVTIMTNPDMVVTMQKCSAIVTNEGGATAHAAIVSREMGIPAVVGTGNATEVLKDGMEITVDGFRGKIYEGKAESIGVEIKPVVDTKTKIKVIVDLPTFAERASKTNSKAIGLTRIEGIIAESGYHPMGFLKEGKIGDYEKIIYDGISKITEHFDEIWIRTSDIRSDEYRNLKGAPAEVELNPMLGMHGIRAGLKSPEILKAELKAASKLAKNKKVGIMMPQIISAEEVRGVKDLLKELDIDNLVLGVMIETPAACQIIKELCEEDIKFISFGTNDLTQYTLAIDRGNEAVQYLYNEMHPAVLKQVRDVISICKKYGVETSICGQAGSRKEMAEYLVKHGIDSISVNADVAGDISEFVKELEDKGLRGSELKEDKEDDPKQEDSNENNVNQEQKEIEQIMDFNPGKQSFQPNIEKTLEVVEKHEKVNESNSDKKEPEKVIVDFNGKIKGTVKFYKIISNYGFINGDDGKNYFVHKSDLEEGTILVPGEEVMFNVEISEKGPRAINVVKIRKTEQKQEDSGQSAQEIIEETESADELIKETDKEEIFDVFK